MKDILTVVHGNIKKNKGVYISVFVLMMLVSVTLFTGFAFYVNSYKTEKNSMKECGYGDHFGLTRDIESLEKRGISIEQFKKDIENCECVEKTVFTNALNASLIDLNGKGSNNTIVILSDQDETVSFRLFDEKGNGYKEKLKKGEISVPIAFAGMYNCKVGDKVVFGNDLIKREFSIACFMEDPYMGSSVMGIKTVLISEDDFDEITALSHEYFVKYPDEDRGFYPTYVVNTFENKEAGLSTLEFEKVLNEESNFSEYCWITLSKSQSMRYMMTITDILCGIIIVSDIVLLVAAILVLSHNIRSSIEEDYANIGILKSVGMSNGKIRLTMVIGFVGAAALGLIVGLPIASPVVKYLSVKTRTATGLYVGASLNVGLSLGICLSILVLITLFVLIKTAKVVKITPLLAINDGMKSVHFSGVGKLPISKKLLNLSLAYRQFISEKKQYLSSILVTSILAFCIIVLTQTCVWANDSELLNKMFMLYEGDIDVWYDYRDQETQDKVEEIIGRYTDFERFHITNDYITFDGLQTQGFIVDDASQIRVFRRGKRCDNDNEVMITEYMSEEFGLDIGDEVNIKYRKYVGEDDEEKMIVVEGTFIVSGIYDCSNDQGKNFTINIKGIERITGEETNPQWGATIYKLADSSLSQEIFDAINEELGENAPRVRLDNKIEDQMNAIDVSINATTALIYILGAIFVIITVNVVCSRIITKEKRDIGTYKSLGFTSTKLRLQLAGRFLVVSLIGGIIAILLDVLFAQTLFDSIFHSFGVYTFVPKKNAFTLLVPVLFIIVFFTLGAYIKGRKIKKTSARVLIVE